jgi:choline dehydrogenase-like flavoprotein
MIVDGRQLPSGSRLDAQICIIGSGPVGCALALALSAEGLNVIVIEAGGLAHDAQVQREFWRDGDRAPSRHPPLHLWRRRMLGGASSAWGGRCLPLDQSDFERRGASWPIDYATYASCLPRAAKFLDLGEFDFDARTALQSRLGVSSEAASGYALNLDAIERYSSPIDVRKKYWKRMQGKGSPCVIVNAPCLEIGLDEAGVRAQSALVSPTKEKRISVYASSFVLATGGLETARLLLASNKDRPHGLGNENDLVGRYYMTHFVGGLGSLTLMSGIDHRALLFQKATDGVYARRYFEASRTASAREGVGAFMVRPSLGDVSDPSHRSGVLSALYLARSALKNELAMNVARRSVAYSNVDRLGITTQHIYNVARAAIPTLSFATGWYLLRPMKRRKLPGFDHQRPDGSFPLEFNAEQAPNYSSRVYLSDQRDPCGVPLLSVDWRNCDEDSRTIRRGFEIICDALEASGIGRVSFRRVEIDVAASEPVPAGGHHMGTTRWSSSPNEGVVGPDMQVWSVRDLYVVGSALFPCCGVANPTLSAVALAYRLADTLARKHA